MLTAAEQDKAIDLFAAIPFDPQPLELSPEQQQVFNDLLPNLEDARPHAALLHGVTGSGKTIVFLRLIQRTLELGRRALVLVPEISLTPQMIRRLKSTFGSRLAVQHSALNNTERLLQWRMIQQGNADIVVGTRSAVFAPLQNLGLIIMDEEQEHTYQSESAPRFDAHDVAKKRAVMENALLLFASATPLTETYHAAESGKLQLVQLTPPLRRAAPCPASISSTCAPNWPQATRARSACGWRGNCRKTSTTASRAFCCSTAAATAPSACAPPAAMC